MIPVAGSSNIPRDQPVDSFRHDDRVSVIAFPAFNDARICFDVNSTRIICFAFTKPKTGILFKMEFLIDRSFGTSAGVLSVVFPSCSVVSVVSVRFLLETAFRLPSVRESSL